MRPITVTITNAKSLTIFCYQFNNGDDEFQELKNKITELENANQKQMAELETLKKKVSYKPTERC